MWVVQEFVLARESRLIIGNAAVPGSLMTGFYRSYSGHLPPGSCCHLSVAWRMAGGLWDHMVDIRRTVWSLNLARNEFHSRNRGEPPPAAAARLRKTWLLMRHKESTDPRDKIYGVLGLVPGVEFYPDYTVDTAEAFARATEFLINSEQSLMALVGPRVRLAGLPSWVPDLIGGADDRFFQNTIRRTNPSERFTASKGLRIGHIRKWGHLHLSGHRVDTINVVSAPIPDRQEAEGLMRWESQSGINSLETSGTGHYPAGGSQGDAFWRTIIRDMITSVREPESVRQAAPEDASCYRVFRQWITESDSAERPRIASCHPGFEHFRKSFFVATQQQSFFTTARGFFGLALELKPDDEVWILAGGTVPFLLRPCSSSSSVEGQYILVGDCFVYGMMYGEQVESEQPLSRVCLI